MTKYVVRCDMEGVTGVVSYEQSEPGQPEYAFGKRMFMADLVAVVEGLLDGGADQIVIYDEHYVGRNIDLGAMPCGVKVICGKPPYQPDWAGGLDGSFDGLVLLGFHSKFGTLGGLLPHTYELDIRNLCLNGVSVGEIGMEAAVAGDYGVPVLLVTGDSAGVEEARALLPGVQGVVVKEALGESSGCCFPVAVTTEAICSAARQIVAHPPEVQPYQIPPEVVLEIEFNDGLYLDAVRQELACDMKTDRTLVVRGQSVTAVWSAYWQKKLRCQAVMAKGD